MPKLNQSELVREISPRYLQYVLLDWQVVCYVMWNYSVSLSEMTFLSYSDCMGKLLYT